MNLEEDDVNRLTENISHLLTENSNLKEQLTQSQFEIR